MAYSTITGQTCLGNTAPNGIRTAVPTDVTPPASAPAGMAVIIRGMLDNSNPGAYGFVFEYVIPALSTVDRSHTGSLRDGSGQYDYMQVATLPDTGMRSANSTFWEVWFNETDVQSSEWSTLVTVDHGGKKYDYTFRKKRTGEEI